MKNKVLKVAIAILLITTIIMVDFISVGINIVYALENIKNVTNHENVKFATYFKTEDGKEVSNIEYVKDNDKMKLYAKISVEAGYFDGVITLENSNFKLKEQILSEEVSKIEGNTVTLNRIRAGNEVEIELGIEPVIEEAYSENMLSKESVLKLTGTYVDSLEKKASIESDKKVILSLLAPSNLETALEGKVITNRIYKIGEENKRIVQLELNSEVLKNAYPIKVTNFEISLPEGVEEVKVISKGTYATTGEADRIIDEKNYEYDEANKILKVKVENTSKDGKIAWKQEGKDNIIVTLILDEQTQIVEEEYSAKAKVEFYGSEEKVLEKENKYNLSKEADGIIRSSIENKEEIYKGKIYSKEDREYNSVTNIEVNYENLIENATIEENVVYRVEEKSEDKVANVQYKTTTILKTEFDKVLGEEGTLVIKDQNENTVKEVKTTDFDEEGKIVITYSEGVKQLIIEITKAIETGIIRLNHTKVIKSENYSETEINEIKYLVEKVDVYYTTAQYSFERRKTLGEVTAVASITLDKQTLSADSENEKVQIAITLKTDNEKYELYKNPTFKITLPEGVNIENLENGTISATTDELTISKLEHNGRNITLEVSGEQQRYVTSDINPQISFIANVNVQKLMANKTGIIEMEFTNKGNTYKIETMPIDVISSNSKIVTHLELSNYNGLGTTVERYSDTLEETIKAMPLENAEEIEVPAKYTIINNYNSPIALKATIVVNYIDKEENEVNLLNYEDSEIVIEAGQMKFLEQIFKIPAGLYFSERIEVKTLVEYSYLGTEYTVSNDIKLATEEKEGFRGSNIIDGKVQVEVFAQLGDGTGIKQDDEIYNEQIIEYIIKVTNISNQKVSNLKITNKQDNGNIYDLKEVVVVNRIKEYIEHEYAELDTNTRTFEIPELKSGETRELICRVVAKKVDGSNTTTANISLSADSIQEQIVQQLTNNVKESQLKITTQNALKEEVQMYGNDVLHILNDIKNLTDKKLENIKMKIYLTKGITYLADYSIQALDSEDEEIDILKNIKYNAEQNYLEFEITKVNAKQEIKVLSNFHLNALPLDQIMSKERVYAIANNIVSNSVDINVEQNETQIEVTQSTNINEGQKLKNGDKVIVTGKISNVGSVDTIVAIEDKLPNGLEVDKVKLVKGNTTTEQTEGVTKEYIFVSTELDKDETIYITIEATINTSRIIAKEITNAISAVPERGEESKSNEIVLQIEIDTEEDRDPDAGNPDSVKPEDEKPGDEKPGDEKPGDEKPDDEKPGDEKPDDEKTDDEKPGDADEEIGEQTYTLEGYAWVDKNKNNIKDNGEAINDVIVKIIDLDNNNTFLRSIEGKEIETKTGKDGYYKIEKLPKGNYSIIFKYDTSIYELEENSEIKNYIIETSNQKVAITNNIKLESDKVIDLKLMEITEFDLKLDKYISKVIVQTTNGTKTVGYENKKLVREEIQSKYLSNATVLVEYTIRISNIGELSGYATEIIDYLPEDMKFHSELNTQWHSGEDGNLYNTSLASAKINPGEMKEVKLVLLKTMNKENTGITANIAEISETMNVKEYSDIDSNNNQSKAEIMINPATGTIIAYIVAISNAIIIVAIGMYMINKKVVRKEK